MFVVSRCWLHSPVTWPWVLQPVCLEELSAGIPAPLACMLLCSVHTLPVWIHWDTPSAHICLHLWPVCSSPSQIDTGVHLRGHGNIHAKAISWCIYHPYNHINGAGMNILGSVLMHPGFHSLCCSIKSEKWIKLDIQAYCNQHPLNNNESQQYHPPTSLQL